MSKLRQLILLAEADDGLVYEVKMSLKQENAIRSILSALNEPLMLLEKPLEGVQIMRPEQEDAK